ncbi:MAG: hypothetical protein ACLFPD_03170 [Desulfosudaceae bacterium]
MAFKDELQKKIRADRLAGRVTASLAGSGQDRSLDKGAMRSLLEMAGYRSRAERTLDLYARDFAAAPPEILVLDNELKFFRTFPEDVALRKDPTIREMVRPRNMLKIINDKPVVVCQGPETVERVRREILAELDLAYTADDIREIGHEGQQALAAADAAGIETILSMFAELLALESLPSPVPEAALWGHPQSGAEPEPVYKPVVLAGRFEGLLKLFTDPLTRKQVTDKKSVQGMLAGQPEPAADGPEVFDALVAAVREQAHSRVTV